ncbi:MAG: restriction endonuclease [Deltaproteobacteria bacterium]|nr:restriction endonuclease [Deltaproteobacteria bacterium]
MFEHFVANLLNDFGYQKPTFGDLNNTADGIEIDVTGSLELTGQRMIAECKAWSSPISAKVLLSFYGKLGVQRFKNPDLVGFFIAIPGLTSSAREQQQELELNDPQFRVMNTEVILKHLESKGRLGSVGEIIKSYAPPVGPLSAAALLISEDGLFLAVKELFEDSKMTRRVLVYPGSGSSVPYRVIEMLRGTRSADPVADALAALWFARARTIAPARAA